jgi:hypothetical protein
MLVAQLEWAILCDYAFYAEPRKISMIGAFDTIRVPSVPGTLGGFWLCIRLSGTPKEKVTFRVEFADPTGLPVSEGFQRSAELSDTGSVDAIIQIHEFPLKDYGRHTVTAYVSDHEPKVVALNIVQLSKGETQDPGLQQP